MKPENSPVREKSGDSTSVRGIVVGLVIIVDWLALTDGLLNVLPDLGWFSFLGWLACAPFSFAIMWIPFLGPLLAIESMTTAWGWPSWVSTIALLLHLGYWIHQYNLHQRNENKPKKSVIESDDMNRHHPPNHHKT